MTAHRSPLRRILRGMRLRRLLALSIGTLLCAACAGAPPPKTEGEPKAATNTAAAPRTPAEKCLADASAPRARQANEPERVGVRHVLVKFKGSKNAPDTVTRTREEACLRAIEARDKLVAGADFDAIVAEYSDEPGAAGRRGFVGVVTRAEVAAPFADAAFELSVQQMSDVVETDRGFHLILRTE
jgi:peptidyl-prolyl cis-trans isomerase NIMA-interacting 1